MRINVIVARTENTNFGYPNGSVLAVHSMLEGIGKSNGQFALSYQPDG